jgi:hypothetical protein
MAELPKAIMRWEWFSKTKNESIPGFIEIWKECFEHRETFWRTRSCASSWNNPWERNALDSHHIEFRFLKEGKWIRAYQHIDEEDWNDEAHRDGPEMKRHGGGVGYMVLGIRYGTCEPRADIEEEIDSQRDQG